MKKVFFLMTIFFSYSSWALVAPEIFSYDASCPKDKPFLQIITYRGTKCQSCDSLRGIMLKNPEDCQKCSNREIVNHNECRLKQCPKEKPFYESKWNWSGCKSCEDQPTHITKEECDQCSNMRWIAEMKLCAPDKKDTIYYNGESLEKGHLVGGMLPYAYACANHRDEVAIRAEKSECARCSNTEFKDGWCYFSQKGK